MIARSVRASKGFSLFVVCVAVFVDVFTYGVIVPVFPFALTERLGVPEEDIQKWNSILLGVLGAAIIVGGLVFGYLSDRISSRRLPFTFGLALLGSATIVFALCRSLVLLLIARALQGFATAIVITVGYALIFDKVGRESIGQAMGYTSMSLSMGWFIGPVVGGIVYEHAGYLPVFILPIALVCMEIILRLLIIEDKTSQPTSLKTTNSVPHYAHTTETTSLLPQHPLQPHHKNASLTLLASGRFLVGLLGYCILNALMVAFDGLLPIFLKETFAFNSQQVSLAFLALTVPMLLSPCFGALTDRLNSTKWPAVASLTLCVPGLLLLRLVRGPSDLPFLIVVLVGIGVAFAIGLPPLATEVMHVVTDIERRSPGIFGPNGAAAQAYGLTNAGLGVGCVLGPMGAGFVRVRFGWDVAVTSMAVASAIAALIVLPVTGGGLWDAKDRAGGADDGQVCEPEESTV